MRICNASDRTHGNFDGNFGCGLNNNFGRDLSMSYMKRQSSIRHPQNCMADGPAEAAGSSVQAIWKAPDSS